MGYFSELDILLKENDELIETFKINNSKIRELLSSKEEATEPAEPEVKVTLEQVRALLAELSKTGKTASVKQLLARYGASKLSQVKVADYNELYLDAEAIRDDK